MSDTTHIRPYWTGPRLRLRAMRVEDVDLWLDEERDDHEAVHFLNCGTPLPKSRRDAEAFAERYAFFELRYQKYEVRCLATNDAMVRHMARLGATLEGRIRRHVYTQGVYLDELAYGLTREEFEARLPELEGASD
ncbi:MAG: GNAT family N-acetyltransferase [Trueperaceae bacterium]